METIQNNLLEIIKEELVNRRITQAEFAHTMEVSLPTLKRWFGGVGVSLDVWLKMSAKLGLNLTEVASRLNPEKSEQFVYTDKQETALATQEGLLAFYQLLREGHHPSTIQIDYQLSVKSLYSYLDSLEYIGLIRWQEGLSVLFLKKGEPKWRTNGPLSKKFRAEVFEELISKNQNAVDFKMSVFQLTEEDADHLLHLRNEFFRFAREAERRSKINDSKTTMYGLVHYFTPYHPEFLRSIPDEF